MARNESVAKMVMFLCFGTAILSLAVHWHTMRTTAQSNPTKSLTTWRPSLPTQSKSNHNNSQNIKVENTSGNIPIQRQNTNKKPGGFFFSDVAEAKSIDTQVLVDLSDRRVYVYHYDQVIASYPIAIGKKGWETPTGNFQVIHKEHDPIWQHPITNKIFPPGPDSPLGERWIGFWSDGKNAIGFHGTPNTDLLGAAVSHGCLRMRNSDVKLLYEQVDFNTPVLVRH